MSVEGAFLHDQVFFEAGAEAVVHTGRVSVPSDDLGSEEAMAHRIMTNTNMGSLRAPKPPRDLTRSRIPRMCVHMLSSSPQYHCGNGYSVLVPTDSGDIPR